ncbi:MAG: c-type cytochrome [Gemmatimonadota bacterium]
MTNLKILLTVIGTLGVYTFVANIIPQVQSAVPREVVLTAETTPEELVAIGEELFAGIGGCTACHGLGTRAPDLLGVVGSACETRVPGQSCKEYLWASLNSPLDYIVEGFQPIMLDQSRTLSQAQLWSLVAFLEDQGGTVTVNADDFASALTADAATLAAAPPGGDVAAGDPGSINVPDLFNSYGCLACHSYQGNGGQVGPPMEDAAGRDREYILRAIIDPNADVAEGFEAFAGTMPPTFAQMISPAELEALVDFLVGGGEGEDGDGGDGGDGE